MGWKTAIVIGKSSPDWFPARDKLRHDHPAGAIALAADAGLANVKFERECALDYGVWPHDEGDVSLLVARGSADQSLVMIGDCDASPDMFCHHDKHPYVQALVRRFPRGVVAVFELHSVTDYWGFVLYERGQFIRASGGTAEDGIVFDEGPRLLEEDKWKDLHDEFCGEECVFEVAARVLGARLDSMDVLDWPCTIVKRTKAKWKFW